MAWYNWSQTAASNATADPSINWAEGQSPSSINDSARAMMAATAKYRDDIAGALITSGTSTAYTLTSNSIFDSATHMNGQMIAFSPHVTNSTGPVTLTVDSISGGPFYLRSAPGVDLPAGTIIAGTPYTALFNNTNQEFYLQGFFGNPYNIPLAAGLDYWGTTAPSSAFAFPAGQAISRTTYATLFAIMGTTYGGGDGTTTFNLPDKTGRVSAMKEATAARLTTVGFGGNSTTMGAVQTLSGETETLTAAQIPSITSVNTSQSITVNPNGSANTSVPALSNGETWNNFHNTLTNSGSISYPVYGSSVDSDFEGNVSSFSGNNNIIVTSNNTAGSAHPNVQPTIICNYIIRII
jgi:microcystin-dependent protein